MVLISTGETEYISVSLCVCYLCNSLSLPEFILPGDCHFLDQFLRLLQTLLQLGCLHRLGVTEAALHSPHTTVIHIIDNIQYSQYMYRLNQAEAI